jgi:hypothetical protein
VSKFDKQGLRLLWYRLAPAILLRLAGFNIWMGKVARILWHPLALAIVLLLGGFNIWMGKATWRTAVSIVVAVVLLVLAIKNRRSGGALAAWVTGTPESDEQLRKDIERLKRLRELERLPQWQLQQPDLPPPVPTEEQIRATARAAIFLRQAAFPVPLGHPGRSYIGGLPRLPPEFPWPEKGTDERSALTFLAQIDLAELPLIEASHLPRSGTLYFFSDTNQDSPEPCDGCVLYYPGDTTDVPIRDLTHNALPYGIGGEPWPWLAEESVWARTSFRFPIEFVKLDTFRDFFIEPGSTRLPARNKEAFGNLMGTELFRCFGPPPTTTEDLWQVFRDDREQWPFAWVAIEYGARAIVHAVQNVLSRKEAAGAASVYQRIGHAAAKWIERAASETSHERPKDDTRVAFLNEWRGLVEEFRSTSGRLKIYGADRHLDLAGIVIASCYVCTSQDAADVIPEVYRNTLIQLDAIGLHFTRHQMLGHGTRVQWAPIQYADQILLLQLMGHEALGWHSNFGCALQFWISADALQRRAFDTVELTLECD